MRYVRLYFLILRQSLIRESQYPTEFWSAVVGYLAELAIRVGFFGVIFLSGVISVRGWSLPDLIFLQAIAALVWNIWAFFFGANLGAIPKLVQRGRLDHLLLLPVDAQFHMSLRQANLSSLFSSLTVVPVFLWCLPRLSTTLTMGDAMRMALLVACGITISYVLNFLPAILSFWVVEPAGAAFLVGEVVSYASYPSDIYQTALRTVLTYVFPVLLIANEAAAEAVGHSRAGLIPTVVVCGLGLVVTRVCYKAGLRRYTGASA